MVARGHENFNKPIFSPWMVVFAALVRHFNDTSATYVAPNHLSLVENEEEIEFSIEENVQAKLLVDWGRNSNGFHAFYARLWMGL